MRAIFLSYRRDDSEGEAGRLFDDLIGHFGEDSVFMDVAAIEAGRDFRKAIDESVSSCGVLLAVIGREWTTAKNEAGQRRLDDPLDFVRLETASALKRDIPVIPVLVHGARMPRTNQLPDDLKELAYRNGVELTHARWNSDLQLLIKSLRPHVGDSKKQAVIGSSSPRGRKTLLWIGLAMFAAIALTSAGFWIGSARVAMRHEAEQKVVADKEQEDARLAAEKAATEQKTQEDEAAAQKAADEQAAEAKAAAEKEAADQAAEEERIADEKAMEEQEALADKQAAEQAAAEKEAADKAAAETAAAEKVAAEKEERELAQKAAMEQRLRDEKTAARQRALAEKQAADRAAAKKAADARAVEAKRIAAEKAAADQEARERKQAEDRAAAETAAKILTGILEGGVHHQKSDSNKSQQLPSGRPIPGKPGFVLSPFNGTTAIDVRGLASGTVVRDPETRRAFLVP